MPLVMAKESFPFMGREWPLCLIRHLAALCTGSTLQQIADELKISVNTVRTYDTRVRDLLNLRSRPEIMVLAMENGFDTKGHFNGSPVYPGICAADTQTPPDSPTPSA